MKPKRGIVSAATTFIVISLMIQRNVSLQITPTPAPSKTPAPIATNSTLITAKPQSTTGTFTAKTQSDLGVLTGNIQRPNGLMWYNNKLYTACSGDWTVYEIDPSTGATSQYIYGVRNAHTLYATSEDNQLNLWIPDFQSNTLVHIHRGIAETITSELKGPWGITSLDDQTFAITNLLSNNVLSVKTTGETQELISGLRSPTGIAIDKDFIYVANTGSTRRSIEWFAKTEMTNNTPIQSDNLPEHELVTGLQNTTNLTIGPDGLLYFSYALGSRGIVGRVDPERCRTNRGCTSDQVEIVLYTQLAAPLAGLTLSPDMKLYVHSIFSPDIYWVQLDPAAEN